MDYQRWTSTGAVLIAAIGTFLQLQQLQIMKTQLPSAAEAGTSRSPKSKAYWLIAIMIMLAAASWVPYFISKQSVVDDSAIMKMWGEVPHRPGEPSRVRVIADGSRLLSYRSGYQLAAMCFHHDGMKDSLDVSDLQKSELYDIRNGDMLIVFKVDDKFEQEFLSGMRGTNYFLFLVPHGIRMEQFSTIRQALALGVIQLGGGYGPP